MFWLQKDPLYVKVNKLTSTKTQLPYSYYSLPYCRPDTIVDSAENLGEVLRGDRIENSPYAVSRFVIFYCYILFPNIMDSCQDFSDFSFLLFSFFSLLQFEMREPHMCQIVCKITLNDKDAKDLKEKIEDEYRVNMYVNQLAFYAI